VNNQIDRPPDSDNINFKILLDCVRKCYEIFIALYLDEHKDQWSQIPLAVGRVFTEVMYLFHFLTFLALVYNNCVFLTYNAMNLSYQSYEYFEKCANPAAYMGVGVLGGVSPESEIPYPDPSQTRCLGKILTKKRVFKAFLSDFQTCLRHSSESCPTQIFGAAHV